MFSLDAPIRNVAVDFDGAVADLPSEAIEIVLDRGSLHDLGLLAGEIERRPWGRVARIVEQITGWGEHYGIDAIMSTIVAEARAAIDHRARAGYASRIRQWRLDAGLTLREMAALAGTSESTLSAYENGRVAPTTTVLGRLEAVAERAR